MVISRVLLYRRQIFSDSETNVIFVTLWASQRHGREAGVRRRGVRRLHRDLHSDVEVQQHVVDLEQMIACVVPVEPARRRLHSSDVSERRQHIVEIVVLVAIGITSDIARWHRRRRRCLGGCWGWCGAAGIRRYGRGGIRHARPKRWCGRRRRRWQGEARREHAHVVRPHVERWARRARAARRRRRARAGRARIGCRRGRRGRGRSGCWRWA